MEKTLMRDCGRLSEADTDTYPKYSGSIFVYRG